MNIETRVYEIIRNEIPQNAPLHTLLKEACAKCPITDVIESEAHRNAAFVLGLLNPRRILDEKDRENYNIVAFICAAWNKDRAAVDYMMTRTSCKDMAKQFTCLVFCCNGLIKNTQEITSAIHPKVPDVAFMTTCAIIAGDVRFLAKTLCL